MTVNGYPGNDDKGAVAFRKVEGKKVTEHFVMMHHSSA